MDDTPPPVEPDAAAPLVPVGLGVTAFVAVGFGVFVGSGVAVDVGVSVGCGVAVGCGVSVGTDVAVGGTAVEVGGSVGITVGVDAGVGALHPVTNAIETTSNNKRRGALCMLLLIELISPLHLLY